MGKNNCIPKKGGQKTNGGTPRRISVRPEHDVGSYSWSWWLTFVYLSALSKLHILYSVECAGDSEW